MASDKRQALLEALLRAPRPLSGEELASRLQVSPRMIRNYVRDLNCRRVVVQASHRGYEVDPVAYADYQASQGVSLIPDTPDRRLQYLARSLVQAPAPVSIHDLAGELFVSESTLEADLTRARDLFRQHDIALKRDHEYVWTLGPERSRRRLVRQLLHDAAQGLIPATYQAFAAEYSHVNLRQLRDLVASTIESCALEFNEFALSDLLVHLTITIDRVRAGHTLPQAEWSPPRTDPLVLDLSQRLTDAVEGNFQVRLPEAEFQALYGVIAVRAVRNSQQEAAELVVDPTIRTMVAEILDDVAARYLLGPSDPAMLLNLALHVQNMILRANSGLSLVNPLGEDFKNKHPLVHDLALYFAQRVETRTGVEVAPGEVDYLSMHMGMQYMRFLDQRDVVSITLVAPKYYEMVQSLADKLTRKLAGQAIIEEIATTMDFDFADVTSDLIVSVVDPGGHASAPVIRVSPFLSSEDLDGVLSAVRTERQRNARRRVRATLGTLIDPQLFFHVPTMPAKEQALELMCDRMGEAGYTEAGFLADVLDRERRSATSFGGEFAIPHSMHMDANATAISVLISDKGIPWGSSSVRLVLLFALSPDGRQTFRDVLDELIRLLSDGSNITALVEASADSATFLAALMRLLDS
ncbi:MAG: PTS sugar transporter subunit IIA [Propionibacteriaceae bacterium]|nr:PTS sugar transporter subunit IIA [Micropruina sp.]HBX82491.1 hypothetical protein [Propionibacteriaceae bacterium]HBY24634.1 hypothetical protein [Propionibacteriaceae bacterium]